MSCGVRMAVVLLALTTPAYQKLATTPTPLNGLEDSPLTEVRGVAGGRVLLPCDFEPPISNDSTHLVLFYHGGVGTPIYSVDARSVSVEKASHWAEERLGGRAYMRLDRSQRGLVLEEVQLADEGEYRCRVDFLESPTKNLRIRLQVVVPPRSLTITTDYALNSRVSRVAGPFPEGAEITLSCQVLGGHPRPQVTWWHEGSLLDDVSEVRTGQVTRNALSLPPLTRRDLNKTLTCQASNSDLTMPLSHAVTLDMTYGPTSVGMETEAEGRLRVVEGVARAVSCEALGARPPADIQWWLNDERLTHATQMEESREVSRSTLTLVPESRHHGLSLACRASTPGLPQLGLSSAVKLAVLYKPRLELRVEPQVDLREVEEGEDVTFLCHIDAHPPVTGVQWAHDGVPLHANGTAGTERLKLAGVTRGSSGGYTCAAANSEGARTSNTLKLSVKFPPTCENGQQTVYGSARHEMLEVPCSVLAHPPPSSFRWAVNTSTGVVDVALNLSSSVGSRSVVHYTPQTHHDFGELLCWAVNDLGLQHQPCVFKVVPAAKPESVSRCVAERNATMPASYVVLSCATGWDGGLNQTFTLEVRQAAKEEVLEAFRHASEPLFIISGLKIGVQYLLTVTAANARGSSPPVTINYTATAASADKVISPHAHTHTLLSLTSFLMVVAGVVAIATCVSVGVVTVKRRRDGGRKEAAKILYAAPLKEDLDHHHDHTIVCVKECEKEELVKSHTPSGVVSNLYVTPSALLNNCGLGPPQETDVLLRERSPCATLASLDSLGRCSTSTSKTSTSSTSSSATVALNPEFLAKNPDYRTPEYRHPLPDFIMRTPDSLAFNPDYPAKKAEYLGRTPDYVIRNLECLALNSECLGQNPDCPARHPDCPARHPEYPARHPDCPVQNPDCLARNPVCPAGNPCCPARNPECVSSRYPGCVGREEAVRLVPPHRESSV